MENGNPTKIRIRPQKALLPPCDKEKIAEEERLNIFKEYCGLKNLEKQTQYISSNMQTVNPRYKYSKANSPRNPNNAYYFIVGDKNIRVCK